MLLGMRLIKKGEEDMGRLLIGNGMIHDHSKFLGIEWDSLWPEAAETGLLAHAIRHHSVTNPHHPEFWGSIHDMPRVYVAEMVCDWKARSNEFGSSLQDWIVNNAMGRYQFSEGDEVYKEIQEFFNLLCEVPFKPVQTVPVTT